MRNKVKLLISSVVLSLLITNANAGMFDFVKKNPLITAAGVGSALYLQSTMHISRDLSFHLEKVNPFFNEYPDKYNPIAQYVLNALAKPANKNDYDRYKKLAEVMGLNNIPPYLPPKVSNQIVLINPQQEQNPNDGLLENPINNQPFSNVIYTPQGQPIDTSTEFPYEAPKNWQEYLLLKQDSTDLGENIVAAEQKKNPNYIKPDNVAAHHLISATSPETAQARAILEKYLRNTTPVGEKTFNNEINGVFLPNINNTDLNVPGILHNGRHPKDYNIDVNQQIVNADTNGGWIEVQKTLKDIKQSLLSANRNDKWKDMP